MTVPVPPLAVAVVPELVTVAGTVGLVVDALIGLTACAVGVTALDGTEAGLGPMTLVAMTVKV